MLTCNQHKNHLCFTFDFVQSLWSLVCVLCFHLNLDWPHFKCSVATAASGYPVENTGLQNKSPRSFQGVEGTGWPILALSLWQCPHHIFSQANCKCYRFFHAACLCSCYSFLLSVSFPPLQSPHRLSTNTSSSSKTRIRHHPLHEDFPPLTPRVGLSPHSPLFCANVFI